MNNKPDFSEAAEKYATGPQSCWWNGVLVSEDIVVDPSKRDAFKAGAAHGYAEGLDAAGNDYAVVAEARIAELEAALINSQWREDQWHKLARSWMQTSDELKAKYEPVTLVCSEPPPAASETEST